MSKNILERLDDFIGSHKARCANIHVDDGYGASCWMVELFHENGRTCASEVCFWEPRPELVAFPENDEDYPGLAKTIEAALDAFEAGMITPKQDEKPCNPSNDS